MRKRTNRQKRRTIPATGFCTTLAVLAGILCLLALLVQKGALPKEALHPALSAGCLLSAAAGCIVSRVGGGNRTEQLLSGAVPAAALLCCGIVAGGNDGVGKWTLWNAAALLIPCLAAQLLRWRKNGKRMK